MKFIVSMNELKYKLMSTDVYIMMNNTTEWYMSNRKEKTPFNSIGSGQTLIRNQTQ